MLSESCKNPGQVCRRLPLSQNDFGHASPEGAVMIHLGKAQILERKMTQALDCFVRGKLATSNLVE